MKRKLAVTLASTMAGFVIGNFTSQAYALDRAMLAIFGQQVAKQVCADGGKWLQCYKLIPSSCPSVATSTITPCVDKVLAPLSDTMEEVNARAVAESFQSCFNERFEKSYGANRVDSPECAQAAKHMRGGQ